MPDTSLAVTRALISVFDKRGVVDLGRRLAARGVEILSTGGSARALEEAGVPIVQVSDHTGFPEIMDGRVKTLHPKIHGGLLARRDSDEHRAAMAAQSIAPIDLLVCNLYPFEETVAAGAGFDDCIENIDIGGPAMIRAAAKNHAFVAVVTDPADYDGVLTAIESGGGVDAALRRRLAADAFARTAAYDAAVSGWFAGQLDHDRPFPPRLTVAGALSQPLRYGENPHQRAALYRSGPPRPGIVTGRQIQGKALSFNNINDADAAFELVAEFERPAIAIVKHANPCGVATDERLATAYFKALACDPVSAFGGIIAANRPLDAATAGALVELFAEVVIAPAADDAALELLSAKKNLRVVLTGAMPDPAARGPTIRTVAGGFLVQDRDAGSVAADGLEVVTGRAPTDRELADLLFAFRVVKHVKSNAIVYAREGATVGIGAGQMSRVDSARTAVAKAAEIAAIEGGGDGSPIAGAVVASDAFFPFADGLVTAIEAGATAVIQPGGSMRDREVIAAADKAGIAMVFTGMRHFRH